MELNTIYKRCRGHKERQRRSVQNLYTFLDKYFVHRNFNKIGKQPPIALRTDGASVASTDFFLINLKVLMLLWLFGKLTSQQVYKQTSCLLFYTQIFVLLRWLSCKLTSQQVYKQTSCLLFYKYMFSCYFVSFLQAAVLLSTLLTCHKQKNLGGKPRFQRCVRDSNS